MNIVHEMLARYEQNTAADLTNTMREVMQDIALARLHRRGFFDRAAFYGGTCLQIFYGLPRCFQICPPVAATKWRNDEMTLAKNQARQLSR